MKLAIKILSILGIILALIGMIVFFVVGNVIDVEEMVKEGMSVTYNGRILRPTDTEEIELAQKLFQILFNVAGGLCILPLGINVAALVVLIVNPKVNVPYIVIGALALFLGSLIIGILLLIYGVTDENNKNKPSEYIYNN